MHKNCVEVHNFEKMCNPILLEELTPFPDSQVNNYQKESTHKCQELDLTQHYSERLPYQTGAAAASSPVPYRIGTL